MYFVRVPGTPWLRPKYQRNAAQIHYRKQAKDEGDVRANAPQLDPNTDGDSLHLQPTLLEPEDRIVFRMQATPAKVDAIAIDNLMPNNLLQFAVKLHSCTEKRTLLWPQDTKGEYHSVVLCKYAQLGQSSPACLGRTARPRCFKTQEYLPASYVPSKQESVDDSRAVCKLTKLAVKV